METIRLPLVSVFPRKKENAQNAEGAVAGLASTETLNDSKNEEKKGEELKNVSLDVRGFLLVCNSVLIYCIFILL